MVCYIGLPYTTAEADVSVLAVEIVLAEQPGAGNNTGLDWDLFEYCWLGATHCRFASLV